MGNDLTGLPPAPSAADTEDAAHAVTALYREHALGLTRLAFLVLGDRHAAEDVVQDAFCGLYRAWDRLPAVGAGRATPDASVRNAVTRPCYG